MTGVLIRTEKSGPRERHRGRTLYNDRGRGWSSVAVSQEHQKLQVPSERHRIDSQLEPVREWPSVHLDCRLLAFRTGRKCFSCLKLSHWW